MSETYKPFVGPKLKLIRARQHVKELAERIAVFASSQPFNMYINTFENRTPIFFFGMVGPIPPDVSLAYGDAIHCLRASLDLLACDLVRANNECADKVYFPFARDKDGLEDQIKSKRFYRAGDAAVELLRRQEPHWEGNAALRALHELDVQDKHQMILPTYPWVLVPLMHITYPNGVFQAYEHVRFGPDAGIGVGSVPLKIEFFGELTLEATFSNDAPKPLQSKLLLETLESFCQMVAGIIEAFELLINGSITEPPAVSPVTEDTPLNGRPKILIRDLSGEQFLLSDVNEIIHRDGVFKYNAFRFSPDEVEVLGEPIPTKG